MWFLGPLDVKLMFIRADKLLVLILEKKNRVFWGTGQKQCLVSVLFKAPNSFWTERIWADSGHFADIGIL